MGPHAYPGPRRAGCPARDLCSISPDDARESTVARFAVIRRERLGVRI
jgi:hypothetical protein